MVGLIFWVIQAMKVLNWNVVDIIVLWDPFKHKFINVAFVLNSTFCGIVKYFIFRLQLKEKGKC